MGALIRRADARKGEPGRSLLDEAEKVFRTVTWTRINELGDEDREESQRLRRLYREWKETYFSRGSP